jgi:serine/threonine protein phosphatase PrpC
MFLEIGSQHNICEDYIIQGNDPVPYIILADGCSTSENTEMGARILCHIAKQYLKYQSETSLSIDYHKMGQWVIHNAEMTARQLGLKKRCLDATLIIAFIYNNEARVYMYGDGVVASQKDGVITTLITSYTKNAPYYLSYLIDEGRKNAYHDMQIDKVETAFVDGKFKKEEKYAYDYGTSQFLPNFDERCDTLFICSDGILSFIVENPAERRLIEVHDFIPDFMAFKNFKGEYLKRRLNKALKKLDRDGITHFDDLSIGSFIVKED